MSINSVRPVFITQNLPRALPEPCKCTIIPPYMTEKIAGGEAVHHQHQQLREDRARLFSGLENVHTVKEEGPLIRVYTARNRKLIPGIYVPSPLESSDVDARAAYHWAQKTDEFFRTFFKRDSIDNNGMPIDSTIHYGEDYNNAFWNGRQIVYGDGDEKHFASFTADLTIAAHEIGHGLTQFDNNLVYKDQPGAVNEHLSDVAAAMVQEFVEDKDVHSLSWMIGDRVMIDVDGKKYALRSMSRPGTAYKNHPTFGDDPQPASMEDFVKTESDNGGVHINSGILNRAFYEASKNFANLNPKYAHTRDGTGRVWYNARSQISSTATFTEFAQATITAAEALYGVESQEVKEIRNAWAEVRVLGVSPEKEKKGCKCALV